MKIEEMVIAGFGRLQGRRLALEPGLNVVYGPNESGKTTLQKFLLAMLYGMQKRGAKRAYTEDADRYRPWGGSDYRGTLVYALDSGRRYRVEREFTPGRDRAAVFDSDTGADLSAQFGQDRRKELLFAAAHLGLDEETFRSTAWVGQMMVGRLDLGRELVARVANLQESGREDLSVKAALGALDEHIKAIGSERTSARPYGRVLKALAEKREALERAQAAREQVRGWEGRLQETRAVLAELEEELDEARRRLDWALLAEAEERSQRVAQGTGRVDELQARVRELAPYAYFPSEELPRLRRLLADADDARQQADAWREKVAALEAQVASVRVASGAWPGLATHGAEAARGLDSLEMLAAQEARLTAGLAALEAELAPLELAAHGGEAALARVEELEAQLSKERGRALPTGGSPVAAMAAGLLVIGAGLAAGFGLGLVSAGALAVLAAVALAYWFLAGRRAAAAAREHRAALTGLEQAKAEILASIGVTSAADVRSRVIRYEQVGARREAQAAQLAQVRAEYRRFIHLIEVAMGHPCVSPAEFRQAWQTWQEQQTRLAVLQSEITGAQRRAGAERERSDQAAAEAGVILQAAGVTDAAAFEAAALKREAWAKARAEAEALAAVVGAQVADDPMERVATLRTKVAGARPAHLAASEALQAEVRRLEARRADLTSRAADLGARVETALAEVPDTADLRRELEALVEQKAAYDEELAAADLAVSTLTEVAGELHREFAPRLNQALGQVAAGLTGGRYRAVRVDEEANIRVITADDRTVALESLSGGTIDQLYLGLRLALLDLLTGGQESVPLFLDDPFVQYDDERAAAAMAFLERAGRERQIILMTCHRREMALAQAAHIIDLSEALA